MTEIILVPIGSVSSPRIEALEYNWDSITSTITKPYMLEFAPRGDVRQPDWTHELMASYWG